MKIEYDNLSDAMYRFFDKKIVKTVELWDAITDFDIDWNIVWIEMIWVKAHFEKNNIFIASKDEKLEIALN